MSDYLSNESATAGSSEGNAPAEGAAGEAGKNSPDYQSMHKELEEKLGVQGEELGKLREYIRVITPLMENLSEMPDLALAIESGKIDKEFAKAIVDGKVTVAEAEAATQVQKEAKESVEKEIGRKALKDMTQEDLDKLIEARVLKERKSFEDKLKQIEERNEEEAFLSDAEKFMQETKDWEQYRDKVVEYLENHDISDVRTAYFAVKGQLTEEEAKKKADEAAAEEAKRIAANAAGGMSGVGTPAPDSEVADQLIGRKINPNLF